MAIQPAATPKATAKKQGKTLISATLPAARVAAISAPADQGAVESEPPCSRCPCHLRHGTEFECHRSTTAHDLSTRRSDRRCGHPCLWRKSPSGREPAER